MQSIIHSALFCIVTESENAVYIVTIITVCNNDSSMRMRKLRVLK